MVQGIPDQQQKEMMQDTKSCLPLPQHTRRGNFLLKKRENETNKHYHPHVLYHLQPRATETLCQNLRKL